MATRGSTERKTGRTSMARKPSGAKSGEPAASKVAPSGANSVNAKEGKRTKKPKPETLVRDSFTMPPADYDLIAILKSRCAAVGAPMKKNELLRAGLGALDRLPDERLREMISSVISVETRRPPRKRKKGRKR